MKKLLLTMTLGALSITALEIHSKIPKSYACKHDWVEDLKAYVTVESDGLLSQLFGNGVYKMTVEVSANYYRTNSRDYFAYNKSNFLVDSIFREFFAYRDSKLSGTETIISLDLNTGRLHATSSEVSDGKIVATHQFLGACST